MQYEKQLRENHGADVDGADGSHEVPQVQDDQRARELLDGFRSMLKPQEKTEPSACVTFLRQLADMAERETSLQTGNIPETNPNQLEEDEEAIEESYKDRSDKPSAQVRGCVEGGVYWNERLGWVCTQKKQWPKEKSKGYYHGGIWKSND
jgi:hypothetical protein